MTSVSTTRQKFQDTSHKHNSTYLRWSAPATLRLCLLELCGDAAASLHTLRPTTLLLGHHWWGGVGGHRWCDCPPAPWSGGDRHRCRGSGSNGNLTWPAGRAFHRGRAWGNNNTRVIALEVIHVCPSIHLPADTVHKVIH